MDYRLICIGLFQGIIFWPVFRWSFLAVLLKYHVSPVPKSIKDLKYTLLATLSACIMMALIFFLPLLIIIHFPLQNRLTGWNTYCIAIFIGMAIFRMSEYFWRKNKKII